MFRFKFIYLATMLMAFALFLMVFGGPGAWAPGVLFLKSVIVIALFLGSTFVYSHLWLKRDSLLYKIERQPITLAKYCHEGVPAQVYGEIKPKGRLLKAPHTMEPCVFYHYIVEQLVQSGKHSHWKVVLNNIGHVPFSVRDKSGEIGVSLRNVDTVLGSFRVQKIRSQYPDYDHSEVDAVKLCRHKGLPREMFWIIPVGAKRRVSEYVLKAGQKVFVNGWVYREKGEKLLAENKETPLIVSRKEKEAYLEDFAKGSSFLFASSFLLLFAVAVVFIFANHFAGLSLAYTLPAFLAVFAWIFYSVYNRAVRLQKRCDNAGSQIMVELKKRNNLFPLLEKTVKAYSAYERKTLTAITKARMSLRGDLSSKRMHEYFEKQKMLDGVLLLLEKYPKLKADEVFRDFMARMSVIEENIAYFRGFYNKTVLKYNTLIEQFPFVLVTKLFGFKKKEYYKFESN